MERSLEEVYAGMVVRPWANIQPGQPVIIAGETAHSTLVAAIEEACRRVGSGPVTRLLTDPCVELEQIRTGTPESDERRTRFYKIATDELADNDGVFIKIVGKEDPQYLKGVDPARVSAYSNAMTKATSKLTAKIMAGHLQRCVLANATRGWGKLVYPDLEAADAREKLQATILRACCIDADDPYAAFMEQSNRLEERRNALQDMALRSVSVRGPGTDLHVPLSDRALWLGGRKRSTKERVFWANVPIGEIFVTPDWRGVNGVVSMSMPSIIRGVLVEGISLVFENGRVVKAFASKGQEVLDALLDSAPAVRQLGEFAIVGSDAPLASENALFYEILLDEKLRSHIALGRGYLTNIMGGGSMSDAEAEELGVNLGTSVHHDFMIGSPEVSITGFTASGESIPLVGEGKWLF